MLLLSARMLHVFLLRNNALSFGGEILHSIRRTKLKFPIVVESLKLIDMN